MKMVKETIRKVAPSDSNILVLGENGTGKEMIAREIHHAQSDRSEEVFVHVDLGSLSQSLFESELFGHNKGAFTDARSEKPGRIEIASGGTLFLDEIGNLPLAMQSKLLNVLQNREIYRIGSNKALQGRFQINFCHQHGSQRNDKTEAVQGGSLLQDQYHRNYFTSFEGKGRGHH